MAMEQIETAQQTQAIVAHLIGDFLFQNYWMAMNKRSQWWVCLIHAAIYTLCFGGWLFLMGVGLYWWQLGAIALLHFFTDYWALASWWTRAYNGQLNVSSPSKWLNPFWVNVAVDQSLHFAMNALIIKFGGVLLW